MIAKTKCVKINVRPHSALVFEFGQPVSTNPWWVPKFLPRDSSAVLCRT